MSENRTEGKHLKRTILAAALIIAASAVMFQGFTQAAAVAEYNKTNTIPTSYANGTTVSFPMTQNSLPEGYKKANYTVGIIDLPYYKNQTPAEKDMTKETAAELAAQYLWQVYGADLSGQRIEMGYNKPTENLPRSFWTADVKIKGQSNSNDYTVISYNAWVDSVTGELLNIGRYRTLTKDVAVAFEPAIEINPEKYGTEYAEAAKKLAEKYDVVHSTVKSLTYTGQGYAGNDPDISFEIHGENGEVALMTISKYDKTLIGIAFNGEYKYDLIRFEKEKEKIQAKKDKSGNMNFHSDEGPALMEVK